MRLQIGSFILVVTSFSAHSAELYPVPLDNKWGYMDSRGSIVIAPDYDIAGRFQDGLAAVQRNGLWGYINLKGEVVCPLRFSDTPGYFSEGRAPVRGQEEGSKWGYVGLDGSYLISPQFERASAYSEGMAAVRRNGKWSYIDMFGKKAFDGDFDQAWMFCDGLARVRAGQLMGYIDHRGVFVVPPRFTNAQDFSDGLAAVEDDRRKWGYIDRLGRQAIGFEFDNARGFTEGLAAVQQGFQWGYINRSGGFLVKPLYLWASNFSQGLAAVRSLQTNAYGYVDHFGIIRIPAVYAAAEPLTGDGIAKVDLPMEPDATGTVISGAHGSPWFAYMDRGGHVLWTNKPRNARRGRE